MDQTFSPQKFSLPLSYTFLISFLLILIFIGGCSLYYFYIDLKQSTKESNSNNNEITSNNIELKDANEEENINVTNENKSQKTDESKITETTDNKEKTEEIQEQTNKDTNLEKKEELKKQEIMKLFSIAIDNFIVYRPSFGLHTIIAGYPWFLDWGRDTLIAFEGLCLKTKKFILLASVVSV